jgi:hypothetical protein
MSKKPKASSQLAAAKRPLGGLSENPAVVILLSELASPRFEFSCWTFFAGADESPFIPAATSSNLM